eukprot:11490304-Ditylum_brightwellii.AAC.1
MAMVTGAKPASASPSSFLNSFVTPTKLSVASPDGSAGTTINSTSGEGNAKQAELEKAIAKETVLHDTVLYMSIPPSPDSTMSDIKKKSIKKMCDSKSI